MVNDEGPTAGTWIATTSTVGLQIDFDVVWQEFVLKLQLVESKNLEQQKVTAQSLRRQPSQLPGCPTQTFRWTPEAQARCACA